MADFTGRGTHSRGLSRTTAREICHLPTRIGSMYPEALPGLRPTDHADGSAMPCSQLCALEDDAHYSHSGWNGISRAEEGEASRVKHQSHCLHDLPQRSTPPDPLDPDNSTQPFSARGPGEGSKGLSKGVDHPGVTSLHWHRCHSDNRGTCKRKHRVR